MKVVFIKPNNLGSALMRGDQMASALKALEVDSEVRTDIEGVEGSIVVFVKNADPVQVQRAKEKNLVVYDVVDKFSRKDLLHEAISFRLVDAVIMPNKTCVDYFGPLFGSIPAAVIPHHWDPRIQENCERFGSYPYDFRLGYLGESFNHDFKDELVDVMGVYKLEHILEYAPFFTCHYSVRQPNSPEFLFKPATKVSTAAAVNANIITTRDKSTVDLLGDDYPYYVDDYSPKGVFKVIQKAHETFEEEEWWRGIKLMKQARDITSIETVAKQYIEFFADLQKMKEAA